MKDNDLMLQIAGGILLAATTIGVVRAVQYRIAVNQANEQIQAFADSMAAQTKQLQYENAERSRRQDQAREGQALQAQVRAGAEEQSSAPPVGHRCIGKDLFRRVENGWVQITDGSAKRICRG